ncbi:MAG TPA: hypothetical protein VGJ80_06330 [Gemmatimonadales bacterium]|jgi:hypothetical protein
MADDTFTGADFAPTAASADAAGSSAAVATPDPSPQPGAATTQPGDTTGIPPAESQGPIPFPVHKTALDNARTKARDEALAEWRKAHGWAESIPAERAQLALRVADAIDADPIAWIGQAIARLQADPVYGAKLRSLAGRTLAPGRQPASSDTVDMTPIQLEDGRQLLTGDQVKALLSEAIAAIRQEYEPVVKTAAELKAERDTIQQQARIDTFGVQSATDIKSWPGMDDPDAVAAFKAELAAVPMRTDDEREVLLAASAAYRKVVVPRLTTGARRSVLADLHQKSTANTVNPAHASATPPTSLREMSWEDGLRSEFARVTGRA